MPSHSQADAPLWQRLWVYQAERFPLFKTGVLLLVFSAASIGVSAQLADRALPPLWVFAAAWVAAMAIFFQMRACDEWKDREDDRRFRPERPIPSGLVTLNLIVGIACALAVVAVLAAGSVSARLLVLLALVWGWLGLMTAEFFARDWLKARLWLYLATHMAIMPVIDLLMTGFDWARFGWDAPQGLWLFLALSFANGCVLELGRKIWAPESEREGVESYSKLLGVRGAVALWAAFAVTAFALLVGVGFAVEAPLAVALPGAVALAALLVAAGRFAVNQTKVTEKHLDTAAGLWVFACYALAGFMPLAVTS